MALLPCSAESVNLIKFNSPTVFLRDLVSHPRLEWQTWSSCLERHISGQQWRVSLLASTMKLPPVEAVMSGSFLSLPSLHASSTQSLMSPIFLKVILVDWPLIPRMILL